MDHLSIERRRNCLLALCDALAYVNYQWLCEHPNTPELYAIAPTYVLKYRPFSIDSFLDIPTVIENRQADCKDLSAWRVAELQKKGIAQACHYIPSPKIFQNGNSVCEIWHVQVSIGPYIEDPSVKLGMQPRISPAALRRIFQ